MRHLEHFSTILSSLFVGEDKPGKDVDPAIARAMAMETDAARRSRNQNKTARFLRKALATWAMVAAVCLTQATLCANQTTAAAKTYSNQDIQNILTELRVRLDSNTATFEDGYLLSTLAANADSETANEITYLRALLDITLENYAAAADQLEELAAETGFDKYRYAGELAAILRQYPDGLYGDDQATLSDTATLRIAIARRAAELLRSALKTLQQTTAIKKSDLDAREKLFAKAYQQLLTAEALRPGCAVRYIKPLAQTRVTLLKKRTELLASKFDLDMKVMGQHQLPRGQYAKLLNGMLSTLAAVVSDLNAIIEISRDYPEDFATESQWASGDLHSVTRMQKTITTELDQLK